MTERIRSLVQGHSGRVTVGAAAGLAVAVVAAVVALFVVVAGPSGTTAGQPSGVDPTPVSGNPDCGDFGLVELIRIEDIETGTFGDINLTVPSKLNSEGTFDWTSKTVSIGLVIVKGGPSANIYVYDPPSFGAQQLHAQINRNGRFFGLSHISFCDPGTPDTPTPTNTPPTVTPPDECPTPTPDPKGGTRDPCESEKPTPGATPTPKVGGGR